jgi:6-phosphofructokinase 2
LLATLVEREGVRSILIPASNDTREDITIFDETTRDQFRLVFPGAPLRDIEWQECLGSIARITPAPTFIVASGSLPAGVPHDFLGRVAQANSKIIVDTSGPFLKAALEAGVYLIKPNLANFRSWRE